MKNPHIWLKSGYQLGAVSRLLVVHDTPPEHFGWILRFLSVMVGVCLFYAANDMGNKP
jgi:hypothetical protein